MEKLSIKCFAGLEEAVFEFRPVTVFIGPQATGKSVVAKLLYFLRGLTGAMIDAVETGLDWQQFVSDSENRFLRFFPKSTWGKEPFVIRYENEENTVNIIRKRDEERSSKNIPIQITLSAAYRGAYQTMLKNLPPATGEESQESGSATPDQRGQSRMVSTHLLTRTFGVEGGFQQIFVTAARAFVSQVKASVFTQLREGASLDPFVLEFGSFLEQTRSVLTRRGFYGGKSLRGRSAIERQKKHVDELHAKIALILRGKLVRTENGEAVETPDGRTILLNLASSGQQEVLPLLLLASRFFLLPHVHGRSIYVEEPEAHLFPSAQREVVDLLIETFNRRRPQMQLVMTTHSPYILTSLNNLLKAGQRYGGADSQLKAKLSHIVPESRALPLEMLAAFALDNGKSTSIIDKETGLIEPDAIDRVSEILAEQFHALLWETI